MRNKLKKIIYKIKFFDLLFYIFRIFKVKPNKILFEASAGNAYGDSPRVISEGLNGNYDIVWVCNNNKEKFPENIKTVERSSIKYIYEHVTSKVWVSNVRKPGFCKKRKNQFYIQTWHSPLRLKKVEKDTEKFLEKQTIKNSINDAKMTDVMISGCDFSKKLYENSFWYNGEVKKFGTPRCDVFFYDDKMKKIKENVYNSLRINKKNKIILYAPTFRKGNTYFEYPDFENILDNVENIVILVRFHHNSKVDFKTNNKKIINVTDYPDMQELLVACDLLITDYSSSMFDMLIAKKKCILYVPDYEEYLKTNRDLYFKLNELPFEKCHGSKELLENILNFDEKKYYENINEFSKKIKLYEDGKATLRVCSMIEEVISNGTKKI